MTKKLRINILILDDDPSVISALQTILLSIDEYDLRIHTATNRTQALEIAEAFRDPYELIRTTEKVLMLAVIDQDIKDDVSDTWRKKSKPGEEGIGFAKLLRQEYMPTGSVVILTSHVFTEKDRGFSAGVLGAKAYLKKNASDPWSHLETYRKLIEEALQDFRYDNERLIAARASRT
jgi:CheY-like chemotaxis protein